MAVEKGVGFPITATDQFSGAFARLRGEVASTSDKLSGLRGIMATITGGIGVAGMVAFIKSTIDAHDEVGKLSQKLGIAVGDLSQLRYAAELSDVSTQSLSAGVKGLSQRLIEAGDKGSQAAGLFKAMGVDIKGGTLPAIEQIADVFAALPDGTTKSALAVQIFGKAGMDLIPMLNDGSAGIRSMREEADRLGLTMNKDAADAAEQFNDNLRAVTASGKGLAVTLFTSISPALLEISQRMKEAAIEGGTFRGILEGMRAAWSEIFLGNPEQNRIAEIRKELALLEPMLEDAPGLAQRVEGLNKELRGLLSFIEVGKSTGGAGGGVVEVNKKLEERLAALMAGGKAAAAMKELALADEHVTAYKKHLSDELERENKLLAHGTDLLRDRQKAELEEIDARDDVLDRLEDGNASLRLEIETLGMGSTARELYILQLQKERDLKAAITPEDEERIKRLYREKEGLIGTLEAMRTQASMWEQISDVAGNFFSDLVMNGKSAFDNLKKWVKQLLAEMVALFAKRWVLNLAAGGSMLGSAGSALAGGVGDGSMASSLLSGASSAYGVYSGFTGAYALAGTGASTAGSMVAAEGMITGGITAEGIGAGLYEALASIGPYGWIAIAVLAVAAYFSGRGGGPKVGGSFMGSFDSSGNLVGESSVPGTDNGRFFTPTQGDGAMREFTSSVAQGFYETLTRLGGSSTGMQFGFGFDKDPEGTADNRVSAMVRDSAGNVVYSHTQSAGRDDEDFNRALGLETKRAIIAAIGAADLDESIKLAMGDFDLTTATIEELDGALGRANIAAATLALGINGLDFQSLEAFQLYGEDIADTFKRVAGQWAWFVDNFYTDAEKLDLAQKQVDDTFEALGIAVPKNITEFRKLVESIDLSTEAGRTLYQTLMGVAPAFLQVAGAGEDVVDSNEDVVKSVKRIVESTADLREEARRTAEALADAKMGLQDYLGGLLLNDNLSPLTMEQQLEEAKSQYEKTLGLAQGGDLDAINRLGGAFDAYLQLAREIYGSSAAYNAIFQKGFDEIRGVAKGGPTWQSAMQSALPANGSKLASSDDINKVYGAVTQLISVISKGVKVTDPEGRRAMDGVRVELRGARKGALSP